MQDWNQGTQTSWDDMRKHFSKQIQMNKTDPAIMKRTELVYVVLAQTKEAEITQRQASARNISTSNTNNLSIRSIKSKIRTTTS